MQLFRRLVTLRAVLVVLFALTIPSAVFAQPQARARLTITVTDPSGAVIPEATVTLVGLDAATKSTSAPVKTTANGAAVFDALVPGRYSITAEFTGFELGLLRDIRVNRGDNKHVIVLPRSAPARRSG